MSVKRKIDPNAETVLAQVRRELGYTQAEVEQDLGIDRASLSLWESGKYCPRYRETREKLANYYGVDYDELWEE